MKIWLVKPWASSLFTTRKNMPLSPCQGSFHLYYLHDLSYGWLSYTLGRKLVTCNKIFVEALQVFLLSKDQHRTDWAESCHSDSMKVIRWQYPVSSRDPWDEASTGSMFTKARISRTDATAPDTTSMLVRIRVVIRAWTDLGLSPQARVKKLSLQLTRILYDEAWAFLKPNNAQKGICYCKVHPKV